VDKEYLYGPKNFITFDYMVKKLLHNILFIFQPGQFRQIRKNHFFWKQQFGISRFKYTWKSLNHSILINEMKVRRSFSLWIAKDSLLKNKLGSPLFHSILNIFEK